MGSCGGGLTLQAACLLLTLQNFICYRNEILRTESYAGNVDILRLLLDHCPDFVQQEQERLRAYAEYRHIRRPAVKHKLRGCACSHCNYGVVIAVDAETETTKQLLAKLQFVPFPMGAVSTKADRSTALQVLLDKGALINSQVREVVHALSHHPEGRMMFVSIPQITCLHVCSIGTTDLFLKYIGARRRV